MIIKPKIIMKTKINMKLVLIIIIKPKIIMKENI